MKPDERAIGTSIAKSPSPADSVGWQNQLANAFRSSSELLAYLRISETGCRAAFAADHSSFPVVVPRSFADRMVPGDPQDPLLLQVLPDTRESVEVDGFTSDPVNDAAARCTSGLLQKYQGRVLMVTTGTCAVHCRYCFRREYPYHNDPRTLDDWTPTLKKIANDPSVSEVILSGGDPLVLSDERLGKLFALIEAIPHIERIRIHTRLPVVLPARVTDRLLELLTTSRPQVVMVVHANHGNEIASDCVNSLQRIVRSGLPVLNQAVLLKGVNDTLDCLEDLCRRLINLGIMPYYLHQLDRVRGTAHFEVSEERGLALINSLAKRLPGYAVPRFVREIPGQANKTPLNDFNRQ